MKKIKLKKIKTNFLFASLIFTLVTGVYLFTLAPTIYIEDSGELVTAAATLGIAHPSGYPLYALVGKLFTFVPLGTIAWRVNLMSAVFGALTCSLLYLIIQGLTKSHFISVISSLMLGFSEVFWSQSVIAEVYTLNTFFVALLILLIVKWTRERRDSWLYWFAFLSGLGLGNHQMLGLLAPIFLVYILLTERDIWKRWQLIIRMFVLFFLGLIVYFYLPLRSLQNPVLDWGNPETPRSFWNHISRKAYADVSVSGQTYGKLGLALGFFLEIVEQFYLPTLLLALAGAFYVFTRSRVLAWLTIGIFLANSLGIVILRNIGWSFNMDYIVRVYYLPCYLILLLWFGIILRYLYELLKKVVTNARMQRVVIVLVMMAIAIVPVSLLARNYYFNNLSEFWFNYDYARETLLKLEPGSILMLKGNSLGFDTEVFSLMYLQLTENFRPDVLIMDELRLFPRAFISFPQEYYQLTFEKQRQELVRLIWNFAQAQGIGAVYANFPVDIEASEEFSGLASRSNGLVYKIYPTLAVARGAGPSGVAPVLRNTNDEQYQDIYGLNDFLSHVYYSQASFYLENGNEKLAAYFRQKALAADNNPFSQEYQDFIKHRSQWLTTEE